MDYKKVDDLQDRGLYIGIGRCYNLGVFDAESKSFLGIGFSIGSYYLETEYHYDFDPEIGTFKPLVLVEICPIELAEYDELMKYLESFLEENKMTIKEEYMKAEDNELTSSKLSQ